MNDPIVSALVAAAFAGLLGYVVGNKGTQQLQLDMAAIAPKLASIQTAVDSVAHGFVEHVRTEGHPVTMEKVSRIENSLIELTALIRDHVKDRSAHTIS